MVPNVTWWTCGEPWESFLESRLDLGEDVSAEALIANNIAVIAQGMQGKGKMAFPSIIYKLCKDAQVPLHEFRRTELIPQDKLITTRLMGTTRLGRNVQVQQQQNEEEEDQPMPQFEGGNEEVKARQDELWNNTNKFHHQIRKEQDMIPREIQEVKKFQVNQTLMGFRKETVEKLEQTMGVQQREMTEIKKQLKEWTRHASSRDAYCYWAHQLMRVHHSWF
ncbi:hypothetical protein PIB30_080935 [Stylosanthes scabra]|uniref:Uncharacterized protein n=1 Tax=Stylosanthes scabra TaxID=79078 RepID=A0ABU6SRS9_9FABA|nr:hypothetical protein [Stylosanthes scabra]